jgi:hypothetical protein
VIYLTICTEISSYRSLCKKLNRHNNAIREALELLERNGLVIEMPYPKQQKTDPFLCLRPKIIVKRVGSGVGEGSIAIQLVH